MARGILAKSGDRNYRLRDFRSLPQHGQASAMTIFEWNRPKLAACPPPTTVPGPRECVWFARHRRHAYSSLPGAAGGLPSTTRATNSYRP